MKRSVLSITLVAILILSSCSKKIDGSSEESILASIEKIKASLADKEKEELEVSLAFIYFHENDFYDKLNGMTVQEVISEGNRIEAEIILKNKRQAKDEILELFAQKAKAAEDRQELSKFEVKRSRYYIKKGKYSFMNEAIIELTVKNGTDNAISRAYFTGTLSSPNRSVPWLKDDFSYSIAGGIEPGEELTWRLVGGYKWEGDFPKDVILSVDVRKVNGADEETLFPTTNFDEDDQDRLDELLNSYPEFKK